MENERHGLLCSQPPACQISEGEPVGSNREIFQWHKALKSEAKKEEKQLPRQSRNPRTLPYFHSVNISSCSGGKESNESSSSALLTCWSRAAANCNHLLMRLNSAWTLSLSLSVCVFLCLSLILCHYLFLSVFAFINLFLLLSFLHLSLSQSIPLLSLFPSSLQSLLCSAPQVTLQWVVNIFNAPSCNSRTRITAVVCC